LIAYSTFSKVVVMLVAIYSDTFSDADPVKQDKNILEVFAKVFNNE
jgi:hypothetical protein